MTLCCVEGCKSNSRKNEPGITFHRFPRNPLTRKKWIDKIGRNDWYPGPNTYVCSLHFEQSSINHTLDVAYVKKNYIPTIFLPRAIPSTSRISTDKGDAQPSLAIDVPLAIPSTSGISTNKSHDQPSSATDMANTTSCSVPCCITDFKKNGKSHGISLFKFPKDPNIRKEWVKALGIQNWEAKSTYTICSEHFKEESLYETKHGWKMLYPDALPIKNLDLDAPAALMICRICLKVDSNMQHMGKFSEVFNHITGLSAADRESCRLPQLMCWECAARLKSAASFRHKARSSDAKLRGLLKPDTFIKIRDIKTINRKSCSLKTSLVQKLIDSDHYDVKIQDTFIDTSHIKTEYVVEEGIPELSENFVKNEVIISLTEINSVECNMKTDNNALEKKPEILGNNIKTVAKENGNEESNTKYLILQNNDKVQYVVNKNGDEENDLKYMMLQNDAFNIKTEELTTQDNDKATEEKEISDEEMLEESVNSDDDTIEIVVESHMPKESSTIIHDENLKELDIGVQNVKKARRKKTVTRVLKNPAKKMVKSRTVSGQTKVNKEDVSVYENLFVITDLTFEQQKEEIFTRREYPSYTNAPYKCTVCFTGFVSRPVFDRHTLKHTDANGKFECTICKIRKKKESTLNRHLITAHTREYKCVKCDYLTRNCESARTHVKYHKGKRFECKQCPLVFDKRSTYFSHVRMNHVNSFVCEYCGYTFVSQRGVLNHKNLLHKLEKNVKCKGPYCKECDVTFLSEDAHSKHLRLSSKHLKDEFDPLRIRNEPTHGKRTERQYTQRFKDNIYPVKKRNPMTCEQCGEELYNYRSYANHFLRRHPGLSRTQYSQSNPYICELCGKKFISANAVSCHQWVHTGKKMYQCDHCDKSFVQKSTLRTHLESVKEQGRPRHQCSECGKVFTFVSNLKRHEIIHTGLKLFECDICNKKFNTNSSLYQHIKHTHKKIPWPRKGKQKDVKKK